MRYFIRLWIGSENAIPQPHVLRVYQTDARDDNGLKDTYYEIAPWSHRYDVQGSEMTAFHPDNIQALCDALPHLHIGWASRVTDIDIVPI